MFSDVAFANVTTNVSQIHSATHMKNYFQPEEILQQLELGPQRIDVNKLSKMLGAASPNLKKMTTIISLTLAPTDWQCSHQCGT